MTDLKSGAGSKKSAMSASEVASKIIERADRDVAVVVQIVGESQYLLVRHFETFIEGELARRGVVYGDHLLLRPLIETHGRELAEFVMSGVAIHHKFGLQALESPAGDPLRLLRSDVWDSLRSHIEDAQRHFVSDAGGMLLILAEIEKNQPKMVRPAGV